MCVHTPSAFCADLQPDVELPAGAEQRVHLRFTSGSCMTLEPLLAAEDQQQQQQHGSLFGRLLGGAKSGRGWGAVKQAGPSVLHGQELTQEQRQQQQPQQQQQQQQQDEHRAREQLTRIVVVCNIETGHTHVPEALISFVLKVFAPFMYSTVVQVLATSFADPSSPLPQRLAEHAELYSMVEHRIADFLDGHPD